jgi:hypothetical protein
MGKYPEGTPTSSTGHRFGRKAAYDAGVPWEGIAPVVRPVQAINAELRQKRTAKAQLTEWVRRYPVLERLAQRLRRLGFTPAHILSDERFVKELERQKRRLPVVGPAPK